VADIGHQARSTTSEADNTHETDPGNLGRLLLNYTPKGHGFIWRSAPADKFQIRLPDTLTQLLIRFQHSAYAGTICVRLSSALKQRRDIFRKRIVN
jgi:hypothetical protein